MKILILINVLCFFLTPAANASRAFQYYSCKDELGNYARFTQSQRLAYMRNSGFECTTVAVPAYPENFTKGAWSYHHNSGSDWDGLRPLQ